MPRRKGWLWLAAAVAVVWIVGSVSGGGSSDPSPDRPSPGVTTSAPESVSEPGPALPDSSGPVPSQAASPRPGRRTALSALATLAVKGRAPMTDYSREQFAQAWLDADRNGCDTRNDILGRDLTDVRFKAGTGHCVALTGVLPDPYTGTDISFRQGGDQVDIDHVVALGDAWATGAARKAFKTRAALANDPLNLLAVDMHENRSKGDGDAASWLPPAHRYRCSYVARQIAVKKKYRLWVTPSEHDAMVRVLDGCPGQRLPVDTTRAPTTVDQNINPPSSASTSRPLGLAGSGSGSVSYQNCDAVRAAGKAPLHSGDPGYSSKLDRDGDGVACE